MPDQPLSTPLSHALVAFTIELDNEFERRFAEAGVGRRFGISLVMWSNFLRFVGDGVSVGELPAAAGLPKARVHSMLGGMERWRYVFVDAGHGEPTSKRDGWGSGRGLRGDWVVRPTVAGNVARELWPPLLGEIETRWAERFGKAKTNALRRSLAAITGQVDLALPEYLPIVGSATGMRARPSLSDAALPAGDHFAALLSKALLAYTLDFEDESELSLPLGENFVRVLDETGVDVRELPAAAGVSKQATAMAVKFLAKEGYVSTEIGTKLVRLTPKGRDAREASRALHRDLERRWRARFGAGAIDGLRKALAGVLDQRTKLSLGLEPPPGGWRATKPYLEQTNAVLADPLGRLPHFPLVLHRGGWPDGS
jgi:DNA-binding MarR family transcriptional regulator